MWWGGLGWCGGGGVGCSLPCFYKKLLFGVDLLEYFEFVGMILLCVVFIGVGRFFNFGRGRVVETFVSISFFLVFQSPIKAKSNKIPPGQNRVRAATPT
jgi:hypothetical protein